MQVTNANVGNILSIDHGRSYIQIVSVTDQLVQYCTESGHHFATYDHAFEGCIVRDPDRIREFSRNCMLGTSLAHAEISAISKLLDASITHEQRQDAYTVLHAVKDMQQHLYERLNGIDTGEKHLRTSLDHLILQATTDVLNQPRPSRSHSYLQDR